MPKYRRGLFKRPNSPNWYRYVMVDGKWRQRSTGTADYWKASQMLDRERAGGTKAPEGEVPTLGEYAEVHLKALKANGRRERTIRTAGSSIKNLLVLFKDTKLDAFTVDDIEAYKVWRLEAGFRNATVNKDLTLLRAVLGRAEEVGIIARVPCRIRRLRVQKKARRPTFTEDEIRRVLKAAKDPRERMLVLLAISCGLRRDEICWLTWEDFQVTEDGKAFIVVREKRDGLVKRETPRLCRGGTQSLTFPGNQGTSSVSISGRVGTSCPQWVGTRP